MKFYVTTFYVTTFHVKTFHRETSGTCQGGFIIDNYGILFVYYIDFRILFEIQGVRATCKFSKLRGNGTYQVLISGREQISEE